MTTIYITIWIVCLGILYLACMYYKHRENLQWMKFKRFIGLGLYRFNVGSNYCWELYLFKWVLKKARP